MLKIGIIGAGRIGKVHLESISYHVKNAPVTAMADPFMNEETEKLIRSYGVSKVTKDYKDILNDKDIDAVLVCSSRRNFDRSHKRRKARFLREAGRPLNRKNSSRRRRFKGASGY